MTLAAVDRLVHHATILEMNVESYRRNGNHHPPRSPPVLILIAALLIQIVAR